MLPPVLTMSSVFSDLECPICIHIFSADGTNCPRVLRCGHTICSECTKDIFKLNNIQCPQCMQKYFVANLDLIPKNFILTDIIQKHNASSSNDTKPLNTLRITEVQNLLHNLKMGSFTEIFLANEVDGETLENCHHESEVISLGISLLPKARILYQKIELYRTEGVPRSVLKPRHQSIQGNMSSSQSSSEVKGGSADVSSRPAVVSVIGPLLNRAKAPLELGTDEGYLDYYYCGRRLGSRAIPGSDGRCGPQNGPQCRDCRGFTRLNPPPPCEVLESVLRCESHHLMHQIPPLHVPSGYYRGRERERGRGVSQLNIACDRCEGAYIHRAGEYFHCSECLYDLCADCVLHQLLQGQDREEREREREDREERGEREELHRGRVQGQEPGRILPPVPPDSPVGDSPIESSEEVISDCPSGHALIRIPANTLPVEFRGRLTSITCDECSRQRLNRCNEEYMHCAPCNYDICLQCVYRPLFTGRSVPHRDDDEEEEEEYNSSDNDWEDSV
mmetsp:Transcript_9194/g.9265  ORF Transcript_9194/g.9265 Transcript_9194/m.9265 type:complete len:505 (+) Transcript_9194:80-1594(+)